ncbi:MAG: hypothetical protein LBV12_00905, partial [Puniceicoccales bacterium]|nr:hypothetical protein [Puniceicoccales bacterium]
LDVIVSNKARCFQRALFFEYSFGLKTFCCGCFIPVIILLFLMGSIWVEGNIFVTARKYLG